jgi:SAM-dependent methyltransferase
VNTLTLATQITLSPTFDEAWRRFSSNDANRGHFERHDASDALREMAAAAAKSAEANAARVAEQWRRPTPPTAIVEIGASVGWNGFALQHRWPNAIVSAIEPEDAALAVAAQIQLRDARRQPTFLRGSAEQLPFPDQSIDVVTCLTVIEHVESPTRSIREMARVLRPGGMIFLEAPNYRWPREPHLGVWCVPELGKRSVAFAASLQGVRDSQGFLDHLKFVTPATVQRDFEAAGLVVENLAAAKLASAAQGDAAAVVAYRGAAKVLGVLGRLGLARVAVKLLVGIGMYPSLIFVARKPG